MICDRDKKKCDTTGETWYQVSGMYLMLQCIHPHYE